MTPRPFSRLLMAVDGSYNAEAAARYAIRIARAAGASLHVLTVLPLRGLETEKKQALASVERIVQEGREAHVETTGLIREGPVLPQIEAVVAEEAIDLAVAAARRRHARENRYFIRTVSRRMMAALACDVLAIRVVDPGRLAHPKRLLISLRPDRHLAERLSPLASILVEATHARPDVLTLFEKSGGFIREATPALMRRHETQAAEIAEPVVAVLRRHGREVEESAALTRDAFRETIHRATESHTEAILTVVSLREASRRMLRSHPLEVLFRETPCDLLVFRPR